MTVVRSRRRRRLTEAARRAIAAELAERIAEAAKARTGRECGACSMCCRLLDIAALNKPAGVWCGHCNPGNGCSIYSARPAVCRAFVCGWLANSDFGEEWKPSKSKIVINLHDDEVNFVVDANFPNRWREEPFHSKIRQIASDGLNAVGGVHFRTFVQIGRRRLLILPDGEVDAVGCPHAIVVGGGEQWRVECFESAAAAEQFGKAVSELVVLPLHRARQ